MSTLNYDFRAEWPRAGIRSAIRPSRGKRLATHRLTRSDTARVVARGAGR